MGHRNTRTEKVRRRAKHRTNSAIGARLDDQARRIVEWWSTHPEDRACGTIPIDSNIFTMSVYHGS